MKQFGILLFSVTFLNGYNALFQENAHLYWKALIAMTKDQKETALKIVESLNSGTPFLSEHNQNPSIEDFFDELFIICKP